MIKKIGIAVVAVLAALVVFILTRPEAYVIERSVSMVAPPEVAYAAIADFHRWAEWSPWDKMDSDLKREYGGAAIGTGATYHWLGKETGEGTMAITEAVPGDHVTIKLDFLKPFPSSSKVIFSLKGAGANTNVTWRMEGKNESFMAKAFGTFMNMDKMLGGQFEEGLAMMKKSAEADAQERAAAAAAAPAEVVPAAAPEADAGTATDATH